MNPERNFRSEGSSEVDANLFKVGEIESDALSEKFPLDLRRYFLEVV